MSPGIIDVQRAKQVSDVSGYDAVVLGTGVRAGRTYAEAGQFLAAHQATLSQVPVASFVVCLSARDGAADDCAEAKGCLDALFAQAPGVATLSVGAFAGVVDYAKLP